MATYQITPEGKNQTGDELGILDLVKEAPIDGMNIVRATNVPQADVKKYLDYYVSQGLMTRSTGSVPETTPQQEGPGFTLGSLERESGEADAEMSKRIADII